MCYAMIGFYSLQRPRLAFARALVAAERALAIDPDLPEAHTSVALVSLGDWDWAEADAPVHARAGAGSKSDDGPHLLVVAHGAAG